MFKWLSSHLTGKKGNRLPATAPKQEQPVGSPADRAEDIKNQGNRFFAEGQLDRAEECYRQAIATNPDFAEAHNNLGFVLKEKKSWDEAEQHLKTAIALNERLANAHFNLGMICELRHQLHEAIEHFKKSVQIEPGFVDALLHLGHAYVQTGQGDDAILCFQQVISITPFAAEAHNNLGNVYKGQDKLAQAIASYQKALSINTEFAEAYNGLGNACGAQGKTEDALTCYQKALTLKPDYVEAHNNLGNAYRGQNKLVQAIASYQKALSINPEFAEAYNGLGNAYGAQGKTEDALTCYQKALTLKPDYVEAHNNLGVVFNNIGKLDEAIACYHRAIAIKPDYADAYSNIAITLVSQGKLNEAMASSKKAIELNPNHAEAYNNLGIALKDIGEFEEATNALKQAIEINPSYADALNNLGGILNSQGKPSEAISYYRQALIKKPEFFNTHSNLIFTLDLMADTTPQILQKERKNWGQIHAAQYCQYLSHPNTPNHHRRLRIGYVSGDFREHSAAKVFGAMLVKFDRTQYDIFAYSNTIAEDNYTRSIFQTNITNWRNIFGLSDDAVADLIRRDQIDILVDLSGHSAGNRLLMFARKPAPIQITAWGYVGGTGMTAMDIFFADSVTVPPDEKHLYTEEIRYLPNLVGYFFPQEFPPLTPLPALSTPCVTFGSFNRMVKISDMAYSAWAQVLLAVPNSRMVLKTIELDDQHTRNKVLAHFTQAGLDPNRIMLLGRSSWYDHMAAFNQVDISLDSFPHGGGVTTLEGFMMGVPVVTLRWPTLVGRLSASILTTLGLTDWIAETPEQYVEIAVQKAQNISALAELRQQLRSIFTSSIIGDADAYVRAVEKEYRALWREWCKRQTEPAQVCDNQT